MDALATPTEAAPRPIAARLAGLPAAERDRLPLWLVVALAAGVVAYFAVPAEPSPALLLPGVALAVLGLMLRRWSISVSSCSSCGCEVGETSERLGCMVAVYGCQRRKSRYTGLCVSSTCG